MEKYYYLNVITGKIISIEAREGCYKFAIFSCFKEIEEGTPIVHGNYPFNSSASYERALQFICKYLGGNVDDYYRFDYDDETNKICDPKVLFWIALNNYEAWRFEDPWCDCVFDTVLSSDKVYIDTFTINTKEHGCYTVNAFYLLKTNELYFEREKKENELPGGLVCKCTLNKFIDMSCPELYEYLKGKANKCVDDYISKRYSYNKTDSLPKKVYMVDYDELEKNQKLVNDIKVLINSLGDTLYDDGGLFEDCSRCSKFNQVNYMPETVDEELTAFDDDIKNIKSALFDILNKLIKYKESIEKEEE